MSMYFKIPTDYDAFVAAFPVIEYLPGLAIDINAGKQIDGTHVVAQEQTQFIRDNLVDVLAYVNSYDPVLAAKIQFIVDTFTADDFELITEEEARDNLEVVLP